MSSVSMLLNRFGPPSRVNGSQPCRVPPAEALNPDQLTCIPVLCSGAVTPARIPGNCSVSAPEPGPTCMSRRCKGTWRLIESSSVTAWITYLGGHTKTPWHKQAQRRAAVVSPVPLERSRLMRSDTPWNLYLAAPKTAVSTDASGSMYRIKWDIK